MQVSFSLCLSERSCAWRCYRAENALNRENTLTPEKSRQKDGGGEDKEALPHWHSRRPAYTSAATSSRSNPTLSTCAQGLFVTYPVIPKHASLSSLHLSFGLRLLWVSRKPSVTVPFPPRFPVFQIFALYLIQRVPIISEKDVDV